MEGANFRQVSSPQFFARLAQSPVQAQKIHFQQMLASNWHENVKARTTILPYKQFQYGPPLDSTVVPTIQHHRKETKKTKPSSEKSLRGNNCIVPLY